MARGVIDTKDVIYFLSIIFAGLVGTELTLSKRNVCKLIIECLIKYH